MGAKENLNEAVYSMFGVGKRTESPKAEAEAKIPVKKETPEKKEGPVARSTVVHTPVARQSTYLAPGSCMEGKLKCEGDVQIAGIFKGDLEAGGKVILCSDMNGNVRAESLEVGDCHLVGDVVASGTVTVGAKAVVEGKISAGDLICAGRIKGDLDVKGNVTLTANTIVEGNVVTGTMCMESGAVINGGVVMGKKN